MQDVGYRIHSKASGRVVWDDFGAPCEDCIKNSVNSLSAGKLSSRIELSCALDGRSARHTVVNSNSGGVFSCAKKATLLQGAKTHLKMVESKAQIIADIESVFKSLVDQYEANYRRLLHNIEGHIAHIIQEFEYLVPPQQLVAARGNQKQYVQKIINENSLGATRAILKMFQCAVGIKTEVSIYQRLYLSENWKEARESHRVHAMIMNTAYKFFDDFNEFSITLLIAKTSDFVYVDYECASIVLYHLMDNARKYVIRGGTVRIDFRRVDSVLELVIKMISIRVEKEERSKVYLDGYSGINARTVGRSGNGLGMGVIREIVRRSNITFVVNWGDRVVTVEGGVPYTENQFVIGVPLDRKRYLVSHATKDVS